MVKRPRLVGLPFDQLLRARAQVMHLKANNHGHKVTAITDHKITATITATGPVRAKTHDHKANPKTGLLARAKVGHKVTVTTGHKIITTADHRATTRVGHKITTPVTPIVGHNGLTMLAQQRAPITGHKANHKIVPNQAATITVTGTTITIVMVIVTVTTAITVVATTRRTVVNNHNNLRRLCQHVRIGHYQKH